MAIKCKELSTALVCFNNGTANETLVAHYEYGANATGGTILVSTRYTNAAGVPVDTSAGTVTAGACNQDCDAVTPLGVLTTWG